MIDKSRGLSLKGKYLQCGESSVEKNKVNILVDNYSLKLESILV